MAETKFKIESSQDEILETFASWLKESETYHEAMLPFQKQTEQYYIGNQTSRDQIPVYNSNVVENRIFEGIETLVPVATVNAHQFVVLPGSEAETSVARAEKLQKVLTKKYQSLEIQSKLEDIVRHMLLYRFGVMKYLWDEYTDDIGVQVIDPRLILIPKLRVDPHRLPYMIEIQDYTREDMEEFFPDHVDEVTYTEQESYSDGIKGTKKVARIHEVWTDEMTAWIYKKEKILDKIPNPYWDFEGKSRKQYEFVNGKRRIKKSVIFRNHLSRPEKPYVFFTTFNVSDGPVATVSLAEIAIPIQDSINVRKRKIIDNLRTTGNGMVLVDSDSMSQEEADNITDEPGLIVRGENVASLQKVRREAGTPLPNAHFSDLQHSEMVLENILGVHAATRGAAAAKTLGQDILSRQQDFTRIDLITRVLNRGVARLANGLVQLMKMFYTETHVVKILGEDGALEFVRLNQNDIEDYIEIDVKSGNQLPMDEVALRSEAVQLWQLGAIDPVTLFERLKFPNPDKSAERLQAWKMGQLSMETQARIAEAQAGAAAKTEAAPPAEGRGVETPLNVLQRARATLGGTAPVAPGTPKM